MSIEDVAPIFERINSTGTDLTIVDLMRAATWSLDFDLIDAIDDILESLSTKGFEEIEKKVVLRNISASTGSGFTAESIDGLRNHSPEILKDACESTLNAYQRATDFLYNQIGIPNFKVIPYANQMTVLAEIYRRIPIPTAEQLQAIIRWFWSSAYSQYFSGWNTGQMSRDLISIKEFELGDSPDIYFEGSLPKDDVWIKSQFRANYALAKLLAVLLAHFRPKDLLTGAYINIDSSLAWSNKREYHHFFPKAYLKKEGRDNRQINCLANFISITSASNKTISKRAPSDYLRDVEKAAGEKLPGWLASNLISEEAFEAALKDDFEKFLECRTKSLSDAIRSLYS